MKTIIEKKIEIDIKYVNIIFPLRYLDEMSEEDLETLYSFPGYVDKFDKSFIDICVEIDTGKILNKGKFFNYSIFKKVCDEGIYRLYDNKYEFVASLENQYVPHGLIPGKFGDYIELIINENGFITNWKNKENINLSEFFDKDEQN